MTGARGESVASTAIKDIIDIISLIASKVLFITAMGLVPASRCAFSSLS